MDQNAPNTCAACGAELPAQVAAWCPECGAPHSTDREAWEISTVLPAEEAPVATGAETPARGWKRFPAACGAYLKGLAARPKALAAVVAACVVVLAGIGTGAYFLATRNAAGHLYPVVVNGEVGFIDRSGAMVVDPQELGNFPSFSEGLAAVLIDDRWGFIDTNGEIVIDPEYQNVTRFSEGLAAVYQAGRAGYVDKTGKVMIQLEGMMECGDFCEGLAYFALQDGERYKYGYVDLKGNVVITPRFSWAGPFSEGLAAVAVEEMDGRSRYGYIDGTGVWVIPPQFAMADGFTEGLAVAGAEDLGSSGYIDRTGAWAVEPGFVVALPFSEGLAAVELPGNTLGNPKYGYIDKSGTMVIAPEFAVATSFSEGLGAVVRLDQEGRYVWGYIDKHGEWAIPPRFEQADPFQPGGLAMVVRSDVPPFYLESPPFSSGSGPLHPAASAGSFDGPWPVGGYLPDDFAYIDRTGRIIWETAVPR